MQKSQACVIWMKSVCFYCHSMARPAWVAVGLVYNLCVIGLCDVLTDNTLCSGDHVSWHAPLDGSESRVQHMLMTEDAQLQPVLSPFGTVTFVQVNVTPKHTLNFSLRCAAQAT